MFFILSIIFSVNSYADCKIAYPRELLLAIKSGDTSKPLFLCKGETSSCVCVDDFPYSIDTNGLVLSEIVGTKLKVNKAEENKKKAKEDAKRLEASLKSSRIKELEDKLNSPLMSVEEIKEYLFLKLKGE